jgi:hypothetical protein
MRAAVLVLVLVLAGCSSESAAPADLGAEPACMFVLSGDISGTVQCFARLCRRPTGDALDLYGPTPRDPETGFSVDGPFTVGRTYAAADLQTFSAVATKGFSSVSYVAGPAVAGSTVTLTLTDVEWKPDDICPTGGVVHGSAHIGLVESLTDDGGTQPPGHVALDATF